MRQVESGNPDQIIFRSGGGWLAWAGLLLVPLGVAVILVSFSERWAADRGHGPDLTNVFLGVASCLGGALAALWRGGMILDRRAGVVIQWWGLPMPLRSSATKLSAFEHVLVGREVRKHKRSSWTVYPVCLASSHGDRLSLGEKRKPEDGRQFGEDLAKFLGLRLVDESMGMAIVREAAELDRSLRERARSVGERPAVPEPPASLRVRSSIVGQTLSFAFPPRGFTLGTLVLMLVGVGIPVLTSLVIVMPALNPRTPPADMAFQVVPFVVFLVIAPFVACWGLALSQALRRFQVDVSPSELRVTRRGLFRASVTAIPADQLEELVIVGEGAAEGKPYIGTGPKNREILARSDKATVAFGSGLSPEELQWLKAVIESVVTV